jgi:hypothetical protein
MKAQRGLFDGIKLFRAYVAAWREDENESSKNSRSATVRVRTPPRPAQLRRKPTVPRSVAASRLQVPGVQAAAARKKERAAREKRP